MTSVTKINPNPSNESELIFEVSKWAVLNFGSRRAPHLGIVEEIGEATHCVLKRFQGIRGFDSFEFFKIKFGDSLADTIIYLADWCAQHNSLFAFGRNLQEAPPLTIDDQDRILIHILQAATRIVQLSNVEISHDKGFKVMQEGDFNMVAQRLCSGIEIWAEIYDLDLRLIVAHTWAKVSQRDWTKGQTEQPAHLS